MCKADREVRPIFFNKTHYLHCTKLGRMYGVFIVKLKYRKVQNKNVGNCTYKM